MIFAGYSLPEARGVDWQSEALLEGIQRSPVVSNSNRLGVGPDGTMHVVGLESRLQEDRLWHLYGLPGKWQRNLIDSMEHAENSASGIQSYALAMAPDGRPHAYWFEADRADSGIRFEEHWAWRSPTTGRWQVRTVREDVGTGGGASIDSPHLAIDSQQRFHMSAYVHNAYGVIHRARHRTVSGGKFPIVPLPSPAGKTDSGESNLFVDHRDRLHAAYGVSLALGGGNGEPGYPDASLAYAQWNRGVWSPAEIVIPQFDESAARRKKVNVLSVGLCVDARDEVHIVVASGYRFPQEVLRVDYVRGRSGRWESWPVTVIETGDNSAPSLQLSNLFETSNGELHFGLTTGETTEIFSGRDANWRSSHLDGRLTGIGVQDRARLVITTQSESKLILHHARP